jgi:hypothetical protein
LILPVSGFRYRFHRYRSSIDTEQFFKFTRQFFLLLPCYLLVKLQLKGKSDFASFRYSFRVSRLHKSLFHRHFAVYRIHFRRAQKSVLSTIECTVLYCTSTSDSAASLKVLFSRSRANTVYQPFSLQLAYILLYIDRRISRLRTFLLTGTLPYTGFTFEVPEHQSYIYKINILSTVASLDCVISC